MTQIMCKITIIIIMYLESDIIRGGGDEDGDKERRRWYDGRRELALTPPK